MRILRWLLLIAAVSIPAASLSAEQEKGRADSAVKPAGENEKGNKLTPVAKDTQTGSAGQSDDAAKIAEMVDKFVRESERSSDSWKDHEDNGLCKVFQDSRSVELTFRADGVLHCRLSDLAEGYKIKVSILTPFKGQYLVTAVPGKALPNELQIRGSAAEAKAAISALPKIAEAEPWDNAGEYGPFHNEDVTVRIELKAAKMSQETKLSIARLYTFNLGVLALGGPGITEYSVADKKIAEQSSKARLDYYVALQWHPFCWNRDGEGRMLPACYYSPKYSSPADRILLFAGISLQNPTEQASLGLGVQVVDGLSVNVAWQPRMTQKLKASYSVGQAIEDSKAPVDKSWDLSFWGVGLAVDASIAKAFTALF